MMFVERTCLRGPARQLGHGGHILAILVALHDDAELALAGFPHGMMCERVRRSARPRDEANLNEIRNENSQRRCGFCALSVAA